MNKGVNGFQARADGQARLPDNRTHPQQDSRLQQTFSVEGVDRTLRDYRLVTDEELMDGLSFPAYAGCDDDRASSIEMVTIDPQDLQAAQGRDAGAMTNKPVDLDQEVSAQSMAIQKMTLSAKLALLKYAAYRRKISFTARRADQEPGGERRRVLCSKDSHQREASFESRP
jgi:hypothetical protein